MNCTGLEDRPSRAGNPFPTALIAHGYAREHATGCGFDVDENNHTIDAKGDKNSALFILGPLTYGAFADQQGSVFIVLRVMQVVPHILKRLSER